MKNNRVKISQKQFINSFNGVDKVRAKKFTLNKLTKKDRLIFSNSLVKCKKVLKKYYQELDEIHRCENLIKNGLQDNTSKLILENYTNAKKNLNIQIQNYNYFLLNFVFKGIDLYFTKEEIRQLVGGSKKSLDKYYLENPKDKSKGFTYRFIYHYKAEIYPYRESDYFSLNPLYRCISMFKE